MTLTEYPDVEQGTEAWHDLRRGMVTASTVGKLITTEAPDALDFTCPDCDQTAGFSCANLRTGKDIKTIHDGRKKAAAEEPTRLVVADNETSRGLTHTLIAERITGWTEDTPMSRDMYRGVWSEPLARDLYSGYYSQAVECGFLVREGDGWELGYSPDGLVGDDGLIEIKAPRSKNQLLTAVTDEVPPHYMAQCQAGLFVTGRDWLDFVSYVGGMHVYVKRVLPDPEWFAVIEQACRTFEETAVRLVADYRNRVGHMPVAPRIDFNLDVI